MKYGRNETKMMKKLMALAMALMLMLVSVTASVAEETDLVLATAFNGEVSVTMSEVKAEFDEMLENALRLTRKEEEDRERLAAARKALWTVWEIKATAFDVMTACAARALEDPRDGSCNYAVCAALVLGELIDRLENGGEAS